MKKIEIDVSDAKFQDFIKNSRLFRVMKKNEIDKLAGYLHRFEYAAGEMVFKEGETGEYVCVVENGRFSFEKFGKIMKVFDRDDIFGEVPFFDHKPRTGDVKALDNGSIIGIAYKDLDNKNFLSNESMLNIYKVLSEQVTSYLREADALFSFMDVLIIQDGGCAPGKNSIIAFLTEYLEKSGRQVFIASEGYRSLVSGKDSDFNALVYDHNVFNFFDHIPGVIFAPPLRDARGANFRSERYPEFRNIELQKKAAENAVKKHVNILIGVGGNGTLGGFKALCSHLPKDVKVFFIPVTIDSDVHGTETIGQHTGVEVGAEKIRCYMADARTHHRCYIIEMMGAMSGYHALNSCIGAGAHLAVLPSIEYDLDKIVKELELKESAVIVVAEGYKKEERKAANYKGNAAEFFRDELYNANLKTKMKVICEPFSRDIRGATPNNLDLALAQRMAKKVAQMVAEGKSHEMPAVYANKASEIPFDDIVTDNSVEPELAALANRLY